MEVLTLFGSPEQQERWLRPLLEGEIRSAFAMTEPDVASSDATNIEMLIERDGDDYVMSGRKWWTSGAMRKRCEILIVMGKTDPVRAPLSPAVDDPRPDHHPGRHRRAQRAGVRVRRPGRARRGPVRQRPRPGVEPDRKRGRRLPDLPGAARTGPDPPLHARDRLRRACTRADVHARGVAGHLRAAGVATGRTSRTGSPSPGSRSRWRGC